MSEYQYYEFRAVDRPLDDRAMAVLRSITSRANITPSSLINVYHFGHFKGNPDQLMNKYFDAHLYVANWGSRRFMLRLLARSFPLRTAKPFAASDGFNARGTKEHVILDFRSEDEAGWDDFDDGESWLASLISLRSDLLAGDLRCLYLGWLAGVQSGEVGVSKKEPCVPPGLQRISAPLRRFAEFLRLDADLVTVAAEASDQNVPKNPPVETMTAWIRTLPVAEKDDIVGRLMQGKADSLVTELHQRFRAAQTRKSERTVEAGGGRGQRTAGDLIAARDRVSAAKRHKAERRAMKQQKS